MTIDPSSMPYRKGVGIMLFNEHGLVWIGRRLPKWEGDHSEYLWQCPQGGIDPGEEPAEAALRELEEEIGTANAQIIAETREWVSYDLPREKLGIALNGKYRGQQQKWFAMRFLGSDDEVNLEPVGDHKQEFDAWRWAELHELPELVVGFKRPVYETVIAEFRVKVGL